MKRTRTLLYLALLFATAGLIGCTVGPNYARPTVDVPGAYRGAAPDASDKESDQREQLKPEQQPATQPEQAKPEQQATGSTAKPEQAQPAQPNTPTVQSLGDEKWWEVFQDPALQGLIRTALKNNYDVRIAATRVLQAQAQLGITHADQLPTLSGGGTIYSQQSPVIGPIPSYELTQGNLTVSAGWNPDFWGRYRRATESARATLLANEWAQKAVISSLVGSVAADYFTLRELDLELEISKRTYVSRQQSLELTQRLEQAGFNTLLDVRQSEQLVYTAATEIPDLERQIAQEENAISILLGNNPGDVPRGLKLTEEPHSPEVPAGLPSALLERRPDIREAEQTLVAANAQIGVAKSMYFPQISLTAQAGYESPSLTNLFTGPAGLWNLAASFTQPIFEGGRLKNGVRLSEAQKEQMLLGYEQTIQGAFRDVSNALVAYRKDREFRVQQEHLLASAQDAANLSNQRFNAGTTDYLEVLTNETNAFSAELGLAQAQGNELIAMVQLYQALGGGWQ